MRQYSKAMTDTSNSHFRKTAVDIHATLCKINNIKVVVLTTDLNTGNMKDWGGFVCWPRMVKIARGQI